MKYELGIIGAGNMAEAIARSLLVSARMTPDKVIVADVTPLRRELFQQQLGICAVSDNRLAVQDAMVVLLSVKPQQMKEALAGIGLAMPEQTLVISIAAGISSGFVEKHLGVGKTWRVIRAMPNTPMLVGEGMVAIAPGRNARREDLAIAREIFAPGATVLELTEDRMDAVTALSGSGPAYFFYLVEQMVTAGQNLGLTAEQAHTLATRTALGAARMLTTCNESPEELRRKVTSPGGTTQAAIVMMESKSVGSAIVSAIERAAARSKELGG